MARFHLNHLKLRDKLLLVYIFSVFIPIVAANIIFCHAFTDMRSVFNKSDQAYETANSEVPLRR